MAPTRRSTSRGKQSGTRATIIVALVGLVGTVTVAIIGYLGTISPTVITIRATQTAEAKLAPITTSTRLASQPVNTITTVPAPAWENVIRIESGWLDCGTILILPAYINPAQGADAALEQISQAGENREALAWPVGPGKENITIKLTNIVEGKDWIELGNTASVKVLVRRDVPEHLDAVNWGAGCGGTGQVRNFSLTNLQADFDLYYDRATFAEADYFTLEPGEFEYFNFPLNCTSPGIYHISIDIPYTFQGQKGIVTVDVPSQFICPRSYTQWAAPLGPYAGWIESVTREADYTWNDTAYGPSAAGMNFTGKWYWEEDQQAAFQLVLVQEGSLLHGDHVAVALGGNRIDAGTATIEGTIKGNMADVIFHSGRTGEAGTATISFYGYKIVWQITQPPQGEYYIPEEAELYRVEQ